VVGRASVPPCPRAARPGRRRCSPVCALPPTPKPQSDGGSRRARPSGAPPGALAAAADALKRSPLMLDVAADAPGLAEVAELVRPPGRAACPRSLGGAPGSILARRAAAGPFGLRRRGSSNPWRRLLTTPDATSHTPAPAPAPPSAPQPEDLITATAVFLVREHGLLDAKAMVASDLRVIKLASVEAQVGRGNRKGHRASGLAPRCWALVLEALNVDWPGGSGESGVERCGCARPAGRLTFDAPRPRPRYPRPSSPPRPRPRRRPPPPRPPPRRARARPRSTPSRAAR
jgi:hypothetical protein